MEIEAKWWTDEMSTKVFTEVTSLEAAGMPHCDTRLDSERSGVQVEAHE